MLKALMLRLLCVVCELRDKVFVEEVAYGVFVAGCTRCERKVYLPWSVVKEVA